MADNYRVARVGDFAESISETHPMTKDRLVFLNTSDILDGHILHRTYTAVKNWPGQAKKSIRRHDILFSEIRPANGRWAYVDELADDFVVSTKLMVIRTRSEHLLPRYLYHFLTSKMISTWLQHLAESRSGTFPQITFNQVASLDIPLPSITEQAAIADVFATLDGKIELNRRINETLEAIARATFKSWFVDFDPVRAKAAGLDPGLPKHIAGLFPTELRDSDIGDLPAEWSTRAVYECARFINGLAFRNVHFSNDRTGLPIVKIAELKYGITSQTRYTTGEMDPRYKLRPGDIAFSWSGSPNTSIDTFVWTLGDAWLNQHVFRVAVHRPEDRVFIYFLLKHLKPVFIDIARNKQTTGLGHVTAQDLKRLRVAIPPDDILHAFNELANPLFAAMYHRLVESSQLAEIRDTLLPRLLSGEVRLDGVTRGEPA